MKEGESFPIKIKFHIKIENSTKSDTRLCYSIVAIDIIFFFLCKSIEIE